MPAQRRTSFCLEGWAYLAVLAAVLAGAMIREVNLLFMLAGLMAGPLLLSWRQVVVSMRGLEARRRLPQAICAGDLLVVHVEVTNRRRGASWAVVAEEPILAENAHAAEPFARLSVYFAHLPAGASQSRAYRGRLNRRGRYRLGPMRLSTRFPFGLLRRSIASADTRELLVYPRLGRLTRRWITRHHEAFEGTHRRERRYGRTQGDFFGVRPWREGDTMRWVHWRSSARHDTLVVQQFEQHRNRDVAVLVDLWRPEAPSLEDHERVELAVSFAATVVTDLCRKGGSNVMLGIAAPEPVWLSGPASAALLQDSMQSLALAESHSEDRLPALLARGLDEIESGTEIVLLSTRPVDLADAARFGGVWGDPGRRAAARFLRLFNTADASLADYFQTE